MTNLYVHRADQEQVPSQVARHDRRSHRYRTRLWVERILDGMTRGVLGSIRAVYRGYDLGFTRSPITSTRLRSLELPPRILG